MRNAIICQCLMFMVKAPCDWGFEGMFVSFSSTRDTTSSLDNEGVWSWSCKIVDTVAEYKL